MPTGLNFTRLGLIVFEGNEQAVRLYQRFGFTHEGTMQRFGFGNGAWMDAHVMGRLPPVTATGLIIRSREPESHASGLAVVGTRLCEASLHRPRAGAVSIRPLEQLSD